MAEPKACYKKLVETTFYFQTKGRKVAKKIKIVNFPLPVMWVLCVLSVIFKLLTFFQDVIEKRNHVLFSLRPYTFRLTSTLTIYTACNLYFIL